MAFYWCFFLLVFQDSRTLVFRSFLTASITLVSVLVRLQWGREAQGAARPQVPPPPLALEGAGGGRWRPPNMAAESEPASHPAAPDRWRRRTMRERWRHPTWRFVPVAWQCVALALLLALLMLPPPTRAARAAHSEFIKGKSEFFLNFEFMIPEWY